MVSSWISPVLFKALYTTDVWDGLNGADARSAGVENVIVEEWKVVRT